MGTFPKDLLWKRLQIEEKDPQDYLKRVGESAAIHVEAM
jgi:hypothetical protein